MNVNIGDRVRFLNDVGGGKVTKILPNNKVMILDETGFEIPIHVKELVVIESTVKKKSTDQKQPTEAKIEVPQNVVETFYPTGKLKQGNNLPKAYFAFTPKTQTIVDCNEFDIHIINECNYTLFFNLIENSALTSNGILADSIGANTTKWIATVTKKELASINTYILQIIFYTRGKCAVIEPWHCVLEIDSSVFERDTAFKTTNYFENKAFIYRLADKNSENKRLVEAINQLTKENKNELNSKIILDTSPKKVEVKKVKNEALREIDLHIQVLLESTSGLTPKVILETQMNHFAAEMESGIKDQIKRIVFIHGLGNGTLKNEIRRALDRSYKQYSYHDASFKEYGFGATMVIINK
ncbi:MAG: DUF2027 domain-containing protein [Salinivirgaceae bacterium]|nr:DUF2027 domain-containing protein [Salinivirgaceae bacterium]